MPMTMRRIGNRIRLDFSLSALDRRGRSVPDGITMQIDVTVLSDDSDGQEAVAKRMAARLLREAITEIQRSPPGTLQH